MSDLDIVTRLRLMGKPEHPLSQAITTPHEETITEAADEIVRLLAKVARLQYRLNWNRVNAEGPDDDLDTI